MSVVEAGREGASLLEGYRQVVGDGPILMLEALARRLRGHRLVMVNSTATGGGVAEILSRMVPLLEELGVPTTWEVITGDADFSRITKNIHNALHGAAAPLTGEDRLHYHETNRRAAETLALDGDLIFIHDPQPAELVLHRRAPGQRWMWRCHIDLSHADREAWDFLAPSVSLYDATVFSHAAFVRDLPVPAHLVAPAIDPLSDKNRELTEPDIDALLAPFDLPDYLRLQ
jgi:trehalose synthase